MDRLQIQEGIALAESVAFTESAAHACQRTRGILRITSLTLCLVASGCGVEPAVEPENNVEVDVIPMVVTACPILAVVAQEIGKELIDVRLLQPESASGALPKPDVNDISIMQSADLILLNGANFEPWVANVSLPRSRTIDTSTGYSDQLIKRSRSLTHQHGPEGDSAAKETAWATWLDPELATSQLRVVEKRLCLLDPESRGPIKERANKMADGLDVVNSQIRQLSTEYKDMSLTAVCDSPFYHYLCRRLGWKVVDLDLQHSGPLNQEQLNQLTTSLNEHRPALLLARNSADPSATDELQRIAESANTLVLVIDVIDGTNKDTSLVKRFSENVGRIEEALIKLGNLRK